MIHTPETITRSLIVDAMEEVLRIPFRKIQSASRNKEAARGRCMYCYYVFNYLGWSYADIGITIDRDRSTIPRALLRYHELYLENSVFQRKSDRITRIIQERSCPANKLLVIS